MPVSLSLPVFHSDIENIVIDQLSIQAGQKVEPGMELLTCTVDLGGMKMHDCPLQMSYSVIAAEACIVSETCVDAGVQISHGQPIAIVETSVKSTGSLRIMTAAIVRSELW